MKVRCIYSACVSIATQDCTVLCDPWFDEAYDGAWAQWPKIDNPLEVCGPADYVYISHVHPDHYDPRFLKSYLAKYHNAKVLIANQHPALLERKLRARGIEPLVKVVRHGETMLDAIANLAGTFNIDSALVVRRGELSVANLNDNPFDQGQLDAICDLCHDRSPTVALLPFVGAGPWPQCYEMDSDVRLMAALTKKQKYLRLFKQYCDALKPKVAIPFAGQYWLHGAQLDLNPLRGMADATECEAMYPGKVWVPADGGQSYYDVGSHANTERREPYDWPIVRAGLNDWFEGGNPLDTYRYIREIKVPVERLPLLKLLQSAVVNAYRSCGIDKSRKRSEFLHLYVKTQLPSWFHIQTNCMVVDESSSCGTEEPRLEVFIDARYLFGMLTRLYNANSVRIGSLCRFKTVPAAYDRDLDDLFGEYWDSLRV